MFTYLGSFSIDSTPPNGAPYASGSLYVDDTTTPHTLYFSSQICDPYGPYCSYYARGIATLALPTTLSSGYSGGTPVTLLTPPMAPGDTAESSITLTSSISSGATSATFNSVPTGITANAGWYVMFGGPGGADDEAVTSVTGTTLGWATGTTNAYTGGSSFEIYQKNSQGNSQSPWTSGCGSGATELTGAMVMNGVLYETGANSYDNSGCSLGWIAESTLPISGTSWGAINLPSQPPGQSAYNAYSRSLAGPIYQTPSIWQPYFGPAYDTTSHGLGINSVGPIPMGPSFQEFNPSQVTFSAGTTTTITPALLYPVTAPLSGRSLYTSNGLSGPFPLTSTTGYYPATLSSTPSVGDTSETINIPSGNIQVTADISQSARTLTIDSMNGNTIPNSIVTYDITDTAGALPSGDTIRPAQSNPPGTVIGVGTVLWPAPDPIASATSDTVTLSSPAYDSGIPAWEMFFSDGESRIGTISGGTFTFVSGQSPLACSSGCPSQSVTIAPISDGWFTDYDPSFGTGFFVPNTSTWMAITYHQYGPHSNRQYRSCNGESASNSYNTPFSPDTKDYQEAFIYLYHASDLLSGATGTQPASLSVADPYATLPFPDTSNIVNSIGCATAASNGWAYFDPSDDILYILIDNASGQGIVLEYQVTPPAARNAYGPEANDVLFRGVA